MFHCQLYEEWAPPCSSCGRCSPATAKDHDSSHETPEEEKKQLIECFTFLFFFFSLSILTFVIGREKSFKHKKTVSSEMAVL